MHFIFCSPTISQVILWFFLLTLLLIAENWRVIPKNLHLIRIQVCECKNMFASMRHVGAEFLRKNNVSYGFVQCKWQLQWNSPRWNVLYFVDRTFVRILVGVFLTKSSISPDSIVCTLCSIYLCNYSFPFKLGIHPCEFVE